MLVFDAAKVIVQLSKDKILPHIVITPATNKMCLSTKDATSIVGCSSCFHAGKRSEGKVSLPPCSLTIGYYRYALTLCIAKPDPAYAWHSELNTSLGTITRNQPFRFGPLELRTILLIGTNQYVKRSRIASRVACDSSFMNKSLKFVRVPSLATRTVRLATASLQRW